MFRKVLVIVLFIMVGGIFGCSTATKIPRDLLISSEPAGAAVYMDGDRIGETPLKTQTFFTWNRKRPYDSLLRRVVQVRKEGYASQTRDLYPIDMPNIVFFLSPESAPSPARGEIK